MIGRICTKCEQTKPWEEFGPRKRGRNGRHSVCRLCVRAYHREHYARQDQATKRHLSTSRADTARWAREWRAKHPERSAAYTRKYRLGITQKQYEAMWDAQGGLCAVPDCGRPAKHVDHDHSCCSGRRACGKCVRGILCHHCNVMMGNALDDPARLRAAADWLEGQRIKDTME